MKAFNPWKVFVQYRDRMKPYEPVTGRKYTITHSDTTGEIFVFVSEHYAEDQITGLRDEVRITWIIDNNQTVLMGSVSVDGNGNSNGFMGNARLRNTVFYNEMPLVLKALRQADRFLFEKVRLDNTPVWIHFISANPEYDRIYDFGPIGNYK